MRSRATPSKRSSRSCRAVCGKPRRHSETKLLRMPIRIMTGIRPQREEDWFKLPDPACRPSQPPPRQLVQSPQIFRIVKFHLVIPLFAILMLRELACLLPVEKESVRTRISATQTWQRTANATPRAPYPETQKNKLPTG